ncbi:aldose 1-epimerase family protein [Ancylobacter oerskovii]|uniref:Aldose 1-epimerase family protein n=1 Tax=Ancylobacter oerskovii TaxID=459519 RepID=A0ABW4YY69_9HYPH|nr:aldose 1-epimerase family protein [Ancylobacter oerskovii]MBS7541737.1 aldose 1-epimerase family protein [Ancylobacter oerskovii]
MSVEPTPNAAVAGDVEAAVSIASDHLSAQVAPLGAELVRLRDAQGRDLLWHGDAAFWSGRAPLLFPIVGRLPGDELVHRGQRYKMLQHGLARRRVFTLLEKTESSATFGLDADAETRAQYPFDFALRVTYALAEATLLITATVSNPGAEPLPASFGFHPAFLWPLPYGGSRAEHRLVFEKAEVAPIHRPVGGLLSAATEPSPLIHGDVLEPTDALFERDALIFTAPRSHHVRFGVAGLPGLEVAFPTMPQLGIWSKPGAPFLCIEPWHGYASPEGASGEFTDKPGLVHVPPGGTQGFAMSVRWLPDVGRIEA